MVKIETVSTHFILGHFAPGTPIGYEIYPLTYKGIKYVIRMVIKVITPEDIHLRISFYNYSEKKRLFAKHKGNLICKIDHFEEMIFDDGGWINLLKLEQSVLMEFLPQISKVFFEKMEEQLILNETMNLLAEGYYDWDGVVEENDTFVTVSLDNSYKVVYADLCKKHAHAMSIYNGSLEQGDIYPSTWEINKMVAYIVEKGGGSKHGKKH